MKWEDCINEAKEELGVNGWTNDWEEVVILAKEKYWRGNNFKQLKKETIEYASGKCELCNCSKGLTAHHIIYGDYEETICLCNRCHEIVHTDLSSYGFVLQLYLLKIVYHDYEIPPNILPIYHKLEKEITELIK